MNMPVLALRGLTAFPGHDAQSLTSEREMSIFALDSAMSRASARCSW